MFKIIYSAIFLIAIQASITPAIAQISQKNLDGISEIDLNAELAIIKQKKNTIEEKAKVEEAKCYTKFVVNACLEDIKTGNIKELNAIKKRELEINQQIRALKAKSIHESKSKSKPKNNSLEKPSENSTESSVAIKSKEKNQNTKSKNVKNNAANDSKFNDEERAKSEKQRATDAQKRVDTKNKKIEASNAKARERSKKQAQAAELNEAYNKKLQDAEEHKKAVLQKQAERQKPKSATLPIPTAQEIAK